MYAGGKFRVKNWGKGKDQVWTEAEGHQQLLHRKAWPLADDSDYEATLDKLFSEKLLSLKKKTFSLGKEKIRDFLLQRDLKNGLIAGLIHKI